MGHTSSRVHPPSDEPPVKTWSKEAFQHQAVIRKREIEQTELFAEEHKRKFEKNSEMEATKIINSCSSRMMWNICNAYIKEENEWKLNVADEVKCLNYEMRELAKQLFQEKLVVALKSSGFDGAKATGDSDGRRFVTIENLQSYTFLAKGLAEMNESVV